MPAKRWTQWCGSSPRGRGTRRRRDPAPSKTRFIPAWAGNTRAGSGPEAGPPVHPRVGGEHRHLQQRVGQQPRFIPAWAGNTACEKPTSRWAAVHPRVGGEHVIRYRESQAPIGSSPRGRGTHSDRPAQRWRDRFIPAWAGNTGPVALAVAIRAVHPRVGGEHPNNADFDVPAAGSSPRGRGTLRPGPRVDDRRRFIPAWAGNTPGPWVRSRPWPVHPRVGGEHIRGLAFGHRYGGSSPRGRGTPSGVLHGVGGGRFIPAWAGNTCASAARVSASTVHPRVGGEHMVAGRFCYRVAGSSPRGRGTRRCRAGEGAGGRFIPAWAGNTDRVGVGIRAPPVHPRVGGEHTGGAAQTRAQTGSSPRGRGTPEPDRRSQPLQRFIPAWAGNT